MTLHLKLSKYYSKSMSKEKERSNQQWRETPPTYFLKKSSRILEESLKKELAKNMQHLVERGGGDENEILQTMEKARRLSVYGFASAKAIDNDAKAVAAKALKLS